MRPVTEPQPLDAKLLGIISGHRQGVLATIAADGRPQLSNVLYIWDDAEQVARMSTTADRVKARNLRRDPRAALHVSGDHFWQYAVADSAVALSEVATEPGDEAVRELAALHAVFYGELDLDDFAAKMIAARRLVVRLHVRRVYGIAIDKPPGS
jgi:PPOX class probable F420-dependent enzyme